MSDTEARLRLIVERVERLMEERAGINDDIRDVMTEAKAIGFDPKVLTKVIQRRKMKPDDRAEMDALVEAYEEALGGPVSTDRVAVSADPKLQGAFGAAPSKAALARGKAAARTAAWLETGKGD